MGVKNTKTYTGGNGSQCSPSTSQIKFGIITSGLDTFGASAGANPCIQPEFSGIFQFWDHFFDQFQVGAFFCIFFRSPRIIKTRGIDFSIFVELV